MRVLPRVGDLLICDYNEPLVQKNSQMEKHILSFTTGKLKHFSAGYTMDPVLRKRSGFVFDDPAEAKAAMRKSISAFFSSHRKIVDCNVVQVFDRNGMPQFEDFEPLEYDRMDYSGVQRLVSRILFEPDYVPSPKEIPLVVTCALEEDYCEPYAIEIHCDRKFFHLFSINPCYEIDFNIHDSRKKKNACYYFNFRISGDIEGPVDVFSAVLCPLSAEGIIDERHPGKRYLDKRIEESRKRFISEVHTI